MKDYYRNWFSYFEFCKESLEVLKKDRAYSINLNVFICIHVISIGLYCDKMAKIKLNICMHIFRKHSSAL